MEKRNIEESVIQVYRWGIAGMVAILLTDGVEMIANAENVLAQSIVVIVISVLGLFAATLMDYIITNRMVRRMEG